jgi:hypothetical protein
VNAQTKAWVCGPSLAGIAGSNSAGGMVVPCECFVLSGRGLSDEWSPTECVCVSECDQMQKVTLYTYKE